MKYLGYCLLLFGGILLQTAGSPGIHLFGFKPELLLLLTLLVAMLQEPDLGASFGFFAGLMRDLLIGRFVGLSAVLFFAVAILIGFVTKRLYKEHFAVRFLTVLTGTMLGQIFYLLGTMSFGADFSWSTGVWYTIFATSFVNGFLSILIFWPLVAYHKRLIYLDELYKRTG